MPNSRAEEVAWMLARRLADRRIGYYRLITKWYEESIIITALEQAIRAGARKPGAYFTSRLTAIGGPLPPEAYAQRRRKPRDPRRSLGI